MKSNQNVQKEDFKQITMFPHHSEERVLMRVRLEAESALGAWYVLSLVSTKIGYLISKQSDAQGRGHQGETWFRRSLPEAERKYSRILADKINPKRRSPSKYQIVESHVKVF